MGVRRALTVGITALVSASLALTGCSSSDDSASDGGTKKLTVWLMTGSAPDALVNQINSEFTKAHEGWTVEIEDPHDRARTIGTFVVRDQAVATSAANRRRWRRGSHVMHHLIDPRTRAPARTDVAQATVIAPTAELADVMAKVTFLIGSDAAVDELDRRGLSAVLVLHDGAVRTVGTVGLDHA